MIQEWLAARSFEVPPPIVVADGDPVGYAARAALTTQPSMVITTGGTGISPSDATPEQIEPLLDVQIPGIIEEIRRRGSSATPTAILTRGVAGFAGNTLVVTLPGSPGGVHDGLAVLDQVLEHVLGQRSQTTAGEH